MNHFSSRNSIFDVPDAQTHAKSTFSLNRSDSTSEVVFKTPAIFKIMPVRVPPVVGGTWNAPAQYRRLGGDVDCETPAKREIGFGSVAVRCVAIALRCDCVAMRCDCVAMRLRYDALRCEAVCTGEEERFCWLVFQAGRRGGPCRAGPCHPSLPRMQKQGKTMKSNEKQ